MQNIIQKIDPIVLATGILAFLAGLFYWSILLSEKVHGKDKDSKKSSSKSKI